MSEGIRERRSPTYGDRKRVVQFAFLVALAALIAGANPAAARHLRLVALGDSLTAGYGLPLGAAFPDRLQAALRDKGWDVEVENAGVSGETAADGLARFDWAVGPQTDALIVEFGANDMLRGLPPKAARAALDEILREAEARHLPMLLAGMQAGRNLDEDYRREFEAIYPDVAARHAAQLYPFFLEGVAGDPRLNQSDGLHPTAAGVDAIVARMLPNVEALLKRAAP